MAEIPFSIIVPALISGLLILLSHVPFGREVLKRGIIFIDLAVAQAAATGALLATYFWHAELSFAIEISAALLAMLVAAFLYQLEHLCPKIQEPIIGCTFVVLASIAMLLLASDPHGSEHYTNLLSGEILWSDSNTHISLAATGAFALLAFTVFKHPLLRFYLPFAIAITASVQAIGIYLVFATLILPAIAIRELQGFKAIAYGIGIGASAYIVGLLASVIFNLPSGPAIVIALALCVAIAAVAIHVKLKTPDLA